MRRYKSIRTREKEHYEKELDRVVKVVKEALNVLPTKSICSMKEHCIAHPCQSKARLVLQREADKHTEQMDPDTGKPIGRSQLLGISAGIAAIEKDLPAPGTPSILEQAW